jgi:uracil-DNA glycosylase
VTAVDTAPGTSLRPVACAFRGIQPASGAVDDKDRADAMSPTRPDAKTNDHVDRELTMIDIEALLTMGATAASLGVAIHFLNRLRDSGWNRKSAKNLGED